MSAFHNPQCDSTPHHHHHHHQGRESPSSNWCQETSKGGFKKMLLLPALEVNMIWCLTGSWARESSFSTGASSRRLLQGGFAPWLGIRSSLMSPWWPRMAREYLPTSSFWPLVALFSGSCWKPKIHRSPWFFWGGVEASLIEPLLDFLYIGKAEVNEEVLPKFLAFAEDLRVDGLVASGHKGNSNQDENKEDLKETITRIKRNVPTPEQLSVSKIKNIESVFQKSKLILPIADEQIVNPEKGRNGRFRCNLCEKTIKFRHNFRRHVRIRHNNPVKPCKPADLIRIPEKNQDGLYHCQYCDKTTQHRDTFRKHMKNKHPVSQTTTPWLENKQNWFDKIMYRLCWWWGFIPNEWKTNIIPSSKVKLVNYCATKWYFQRHIRGVFVS